MTEGNSLQMMVLSCPICDKCMHPSIDGSFWLCFKSDFDVCEGSGIHTRYDAKNDLWSLKDKDDKWMGHWSPDEFTKMISLRAFL